MIHPWFGLRYAGYLTYEVVTATLRVARDVMTPGLSVDPAIVEYPLQCETDLEITVMASSITITPGTLTVGIAPAGPRSPATLYVHGMYAPDRDTLLAELREMEDKLLLATRGRGDSR